VLHGVDIHARYQGGIDFTKLKAQGYTFMCTKASEGTSIPGAGGLGSAAFAARFLSWIAEARRLGIVPGLYHWLKAGNAVAQAQFFHALVERAGGPKGLLIQLDCEDNASYADVQAWAAEWRRLTGGHPFLLYTGKWWWGPKGWNGVAITPYLWHSHYLTADLDTIPDDPNAFAARIPESWWTPGYGNWPVATILQYTSKGDAGGLGNNVDLNAFRGSLQQLLALTGGQTEGTQDMWCKHGDKDSDKNGDVAALQGDLTDAGGDLTPHGGIDGEYGNGTASVMVAVLGADVAGDGKTYGAAQRRALQAKLRGQSGPASLVPHTHTFDPAAATSGPATATP
jgi:GH25 family lysozyme M1 (1,4-beta-N-acetylmuramidase)